LEQLPFAAGSLSGWGVTGESVFTVMTNSNPSLMDQALEEAKTAAIRGEVPVGAVISRDGIVIAKAGNRTRELNDPTAHAEILAIRMACEILQSERLNGCDLHVTLEPCAMCAGALAWAQLGKLVYGAIDEKRGFMRFGRELLHPKTQVAYGVMENECADLMKRFFQGKRGGEQL
jgi:tRNA(adenine34) deaminase